MAEAFQYLELWSTLQAAGGTRLGFLGVPVRTRRLRRATGDDSLSAAILKTHRHAGLLAKGKAVREILSADGTTWREWVIERVVRGSGDELLVVVECLSPRSLLVNYPVTFTDADGFVSGTIGAVQVSPALVVDTWLRSNTPAWIVTGTIGPTGLVDVPFSGDTALSGGRRLEEVAGAELSLRAVGSTQYAIDLGTLGAAAPTLAVRTGKNLMALRQEVVPGQVTRLHTLVGATSDEGPAGLAWAYWEVEATSGVGPFRVKLKSIHGGAGPIQYDDQLNHTGLPGGANALYLEKADASRIQITDSFASTQEVEVANLTGIAVGDWVRVVASATGKHLTFLDAPAELATSGVVGGRFESAWDDTVCVLKNPLMTAWATPTAVPDGWTGSGTRTTTSGEWLTAGQALIVNSAIGEGAQIAAPSPRTWRILPRRTTWSAVAWIRLRSALPGGSIGFRVMINGAVAGEELIYSTPANVWRELKIEGLDLTAHLNTSVTLVAELIRHGAGVIDLLVDNICLFPTKTVRAPTHGSNAARLWQEANRWLDQRRAVPLRWQVEVADLARLGVPGQTDLALGQTAAVTDDELGTVTARVLSIEDDPTQPASAVVEIGTEAPQFTRAQSAPLPLTIPFFDPIHVRMADRDTRTSVLFLKATITGTTATQVTITLQAVDLLGGTPSITFAAFGAVWVSGTGTGPYTFTRPAVGAGVGRVVFTATLPGRSDVVDAVDVTEQVPAASVETESLVARATIVSTSRTQVVVRVAVADPSPTGGATVTVTYAAGGLVVTPASGGTLIPTTDLATTGTIDYTITRPAVNAGTGRVAFTATRTGFVQGTDAVDVPAQDPVVLVARATLQSVATTTALVRVAVTDPAPPGGASVTVAYTLSSGGATPISGGTLIPTADFATTGFIDYTVDRPLATSPSRRFTLTVTDAANGRIPATDSVDVPPQDPPALQVQGQETSDTQWTITWSGSGTIEVAKNGAAYTAPGSLVPALVSGTAFSRPAFGAADDTYAFRAVAGGLTLSVVVMVPATPILTGASLIITTLLGVVSPTRIDITFSHSGFPTGTTYDVNYQSFAGSGAATGASGQTTGVTGTSPVTVSFTPSPAFVSGDQIQATVQAVFRGSVLMQRTKFAVALT